jgi:hypothetical protein
MSECSRTWQRSTTFTRSSVKSPHLLDEAEPGTSAHVAPLEGVESRNAAESAIRQPIATKAAPAKSESQPHRHSWRNSVEETFWVLCVPACVLKPRVSFHFYELRAHACGVQLTLSSRAERAAVLGTRFIPLQVKAPRNRSLAWIVQLPQHRGYCTHTLPAVF